MDLDKGAISEKDYGLNLYLIFRQGPVVSTDIPHLNEGGLFFTHVTFLMLGVTSVVKDLKFLIAVLLTGCVRVEVFNVLNFDRNAINCVQNLHEN